MLGHEQSGVIPIDRRCEALRELRHVRGNCLLRRRPARRNWPDAPLVPGFQLIGATQRADFLRRLRFPKTVINLAQAVIDLDRLR